MPFGRGTPLKRLEVNIVGYAPIPDCDGYYINKEGKILCVRQMNTYRDRDGYERLNIRTKGRVARRAVHRLLAFAFLPPPRNGQKEVRHLDGNRTNNALGNLAWGTRKENAEDMANHGSVRGEKNARAILTEDQVIEIRRLHAAGERQSNLARRFEVKKSTVEAIVSGRNWKHVKAKELRGG